MTLAAVIEQQRLRLIRIAQGASLDVRHTLRLAAGELDTLAPCTDGEVLAYAQALHLSEARRAGKVPWAWTRACRCEGCGPVWLWEEAPLRVIACPWCWNRMAGLPVPSPLAAA